MGRVAMEKMNWPNECGRQLCVFEWFVLTFATQGARIILTNSRTMELRTPSAERCCKVPAIFTEEFIS